MQAGVLLRLFNPGHTDFEYTVGIYFIYIYTHIDTIKYKSVG